MAVQDEHWWQQLLPENSPLRVGYKNGNQGVTLERRRIFILPTRQGWGFMVLLVIMLLGATNYNNSMAFMLTFMLGSILMVSLFHTYLNLNGVRVRFLPGEPCFAGGHALFSILLEDSSNRARFDISLSGPGDVETVVDLPAKDSIHAEMAVVSARRGRMPLGRVRIATDYPLGLFRAWAYVQSETEALIYPRPADPGVSPPARGQHSGDQQTLEPGADDFHGLRAYHVGDSPRHIHWKAWAREGNLITRQFNRQQSPQLWLDWDATGSGNIEQRLSLLTRWLLDAETQGQAYGLRLPDGETSPSKGERHHHLCLGRLALFGEIR